VPPATFYTISQNDLKKQIRYDPTNGILTWLETEELPEEVISNHYLYIVLNDKPVFCILF
jgi:hypothetical protein